MLLVVRNIIVAYNSGSTDREGELLCTFFFGDNLAARLTALAEAPACSKTVVTVTYLRVLNNR